MRQKLKNQDKIIDTQALRMVSYLIYLGSYA